MKRPTGVTVSAVFSLVGSVALLGLFLLGALGMLLSKLPPSGQETSQFIFAIATFGAFGIWGTLSSFGLLWLRNWGRVSTVAFGVLLAISGLVTASEVLRSPMQNPPFDFGLGSKPHLGIAAGLEYPWGSMGLLLYSSCDPRSVFAGRAIRRTGPTPQHFNNWLVVAPHRNWDGAIAALSSPCRGSTLGSDRFGGSRLVSSMGCAVHLCWLRPAASE